MVAIIAILLANVAIPMNQFNIASLFSFMAPDFRQDVSGLGLLGSAYFLGVAVAEIPSGIVSTKIGHKNMFLIGMSLVFAPVLLSAFSNNFSIIVLLRFVIGCGTGACFPPMVKLLIENSSESSSAFGIGLLSLTYNLSGIVGLFGWAVLGGLIGWRDSLLVAAIIGFVSMTIFYSGVPRDRIIERVDVSLRRLREVLYKRRLIVLVAALFGIGAASTLTWNFIVYYLENSLGLRAEIAGLVGGLGPIFAIVTPFLGRIYDKSPDIKKWLIVSCVVTSLGVAVTAIGSLIAAIVSVCLVTTGMSAGFSTALAASREAVKSEGGGYESFAIGLGDSASLVGGFVSPVFFSLIVLQYGYQYAWLLGSLFGIFFVLPMFLNE